MKKKINITHKPSHIKKIYKKTMLVYSLITLVSTS